MRTNRGFVGIIISIFAAILLTLVIMFIAVDAQHFSGVMNAKNEKELKDACEKDNWYQSSSIENMPVSCLKYFK